MLFVFFFFSSRRRHTRSKRDWSSDVCSSDLAGQNAARRVGYGALDGAVGGLRLRQCRNGQSQTNEDGKNCAHPASIQTKSAGSPVETEDVVASIQFTGVVAEQYATGDVRAGHAAARVAEREQVMRIVPVRSEVRESFGRARVIGRPSIIGTDAGNFWIER